MTQCALTTGQHLQAMRIKAHRHGATVAYIAKSIGATEKAVRDALNVSAAKAAKIPRDKRAIKRSRPGLKVTAGYQPCSHRKNAGIPAMERMVVPHDVLLERDRRLSMSPVSLTAAAFGDPPPGHRQYLDQLAANRPRR